MTDCIGCEYREYAGGKEWCSIKNPLDCPRGYGTSKESRMEMVRPGLWISKLPIEQVYEEIEKKIQSAERRSLGGDILKIKE